jgi:two-component system nitrate/nitrite response regulator NarL
VVVKVVKGSPAAKAGLKAATHPVTVDGVSAFSGGDSIVAVDGTKVVSPSQLAAILARHRPGTPSPSPSYAVAPREPSASHSAACPPSRTMGIESMAEQGRKRVTVVVADDHPLYREGVVRALMASGQVEIVAEAEDGRTALAEIREHLPDVALLDYKLPDLDGVAVINAVSREQLVTRVLLVSAFTDSGVVYKALETGAAGFVSKEAKREQIVDAVLACARGDDVIPPDVAAGLASEIRLRKQDDSPALTPREQEILHLIAAGKSLPRSQRSSTSGSRPSRLTCSTCTGSSASPTARRRLRSPCGAA